MSVVADNYQRVLERIDRAAASAGRDPQDIRLVVVTKGHPVRVVREAVQAGASLLGENYVEEALPKIQACSDLPGLEWHMIGHVQSRKAQEVSEHFPWVHSVDSLKLARRLSHFSAHYGRSTRVLLECNVSGEETKFGWTASDPSAWKQLLPEFEQIAHLPNLNVTGLMTIAPFLPDPEDARPFFRRLRALRDYLSQCIPDVSWNDLSMGMSADYEVAIQEGATLVRIGQAILGPRPQ
jgi:pyridoxal phosphate enzyme (YggS family)